METSSLDRTERRLAAILAADIAGYSRLIGTDEEGTLSRIRSIRAEVIDPAITDHRGRLVKTTGDGLLVEFASVVDALRCAVDIQQQMTDRSAGVPPPERIEYRIGIHQGDVVVEEGDIFGDGVNVAARLEGLADPGGICVSGRVQEDAAGRLDLGFDDLGEQQLKNIVRPVRVFRVRPGNSAPTAAHESALRAELPTLPEKPSIAVLPFQNMSGDPDQEYFVDGMVEEIITALSRIRWLFVIARNSTFTYKGQAVDVKRVGRELGVRYVLEGSVRKAAGRVRITVQLIEAATGTHLWGDRFDGSLEDVFEVQDQVAISVAGVIEPALQAAETARSVKRPTADLTAYDLYLRAYAIHLSSAERIPDALRLIEEAITRDPDYGPALAWGAFLCHRLIVDGRSEDRDADRQKGIDFARRALRAGENEPEVLVNTATALASLGEDIGSTIALIDRALMLNPSYARGWHFSGVLRAWAGDPDTAIDHVTTALRLSPRARVGTSSFVIGGSHFLARRFDEAVPSLLLAIQEDPSFPLPYRWLASCYAHMGRACDARDMIDRLRLITPVLMTSEAYLRRREDRELYISGLRQAINASEKVTASAPREATSGGA